MKRIFYFLIWHKPEAVSLCEVKAHPEEYAGKAIRLRAFVRKERERITAFSVCDAINDPSADVALKQEAFESFALPETKYVHREEGKVLIADAIITGYLDPPERITHCFAPEFRISNAKIERVLPDKEFDNPEQVLKWLESKSR